MNCQHALRRTIVAAVSVWLLGSPFPSPARGETARWVQETPPFAGGGMLDPLHQRVLAVTTRGIWASPLDSAPNWSLVYEGPMKGPYYVFDPALDRVWSFSMSDFAAPTFYPGKLFWLDLTVPSPTWTEQPPSTNAPFRLANFGAGYDPAHHRVVFFGGSQSSLETNAVYILDLNGTPTWITPTIVGTAPSPRLIAAACYDAVRDRMLFYGGNLSLYGQYFDETWALSMSGPPTWKFLTPRSQVPGAGIGYRMLPDAEHQRALWLGGTDRYGTPYGDVWALDLSLAAPADTAVWTPLPSPPVIRPYAGAWVDSVRSRLVEFGGRMSSSEGRYDSWALSLDASPTWTALSTDSLRPPARVGHIAFSGGSPERWFTALGAPAGTWARPFPDEKPWASIGAGGPDPRFWSGAINDVAGSQALVFGGSSASTPDATGTEYADLWSFDLAGSSWSPLSPPSSPTIRADALTLFDPVRRRLIVQGGRATLAGATRPRTDTWAYDVSANTWSALAVGGYGGRWQQAGVYDPVRDRLVAFGGKDTVTQFNDVHVLPLGVAGSWSTLATFGTPPVVTSPGSVRAAYDAGSDRMIVLNAESNRLEAYALTLDATPTWSPLALDGNPAPARENFAFTVDPSTRRLLVAEGTDLTYSSPTQEVWLLYLDSTTPTLVSLVSSSASADGVRIVWQLSPEAAAAVVDRRPEGEGWSRLGAFNPDGSHRVEVLDADVVAGRSYDYRISAVGSGAERVLDQIRVGVPARQVLSLDGATPNPSSGALRVRFALGSASPASIEAFDVLGHRVLRREVGAFGAGAHTLEMASEERPLAPGMYFLRLAQGGATRFSRIVVVR